MNSRTSIPTTPWYDDALFELASLWWRHRLSIVLTLGLLVLLPFLLSSNINTAHYVAVGCFSLLCVRELVRFIRLGIRWS
jgi:hypothetical protein